jgi:biotin synthase
MAGIGPFIPQKNTPLRNHSKGDGELVLVCLALLRLLMPEILLPATTALVTLDQSFRARAFYAGANVVMPNLSPLECRKKYTLYDGKVFTGQESAQELETIKKHIEEAGFFPIMNRGDNVLWKRK